MSSQTILSEHAILRRYQDLDAKVDRAECDGLAARWAFGREMLKEAEKNGGTLVRGRLDELAKATGKSRTELSYRLRFAKDYQKLSKALESLHCWNDFVNPKTDDMGVHYSSETSEWDTEWGNPVRSRP